MRYKRIDLSQFTSEQRQALADFQRQVQDTHVQQVEAANVARQVFSAMVSAPTHSIVSGEYPEQGEPPEQAQWNIGAPQVNYVDHIEGISEDG